MFRSSFNRQYQAVVADEWRLTTVDINSRCHLLYRPLLLLVPLPSRHRHRMVGRVKLMSLLKVAARNCTPSRSDKMSHEAENPRVKADEDPHGCTR